MFDHVSKHLELSLNDSAAPRFSTSVLDVWKQDQNTRASVWYITLNHARQRFSSGRLDFTNYLDITWIIFKHLTQSTFTPQAHKTDQSHDILFREYNRKLHLKTPLLLLTNLHGYLEGLFEGDIDLDDDMRNAIFGKIQLRDTLNLGDAYRWPDATMPYVFDGLREWPAIGDFWIVFPLCFKARRSSY